MLGHSSYDTTLIYASIPTEELKRKSKNYLQQKNKFWIKLKNRLFPPSTPKLVNLNCKEYFTIGGDMNSTRISVDNNWCQYNVPPGYGCRKNHILKNIKATKKILKF